MLIDWFTVSAQALNFVVLVWLMKRFLYKPILDAIDARQKRIDSQLEQAAASRAEAEEERAEFQRKNEAFDQERADLLSQATDAARAAGRRLESEARESAKALEAQHAHRLHEEAADLGQAVGDRAREAVFSVARRTLSDLAGASLEARICTAFTRRLRELGEEAKARLGKALETAPAPAIIRSAFELVEPQRAAIRAALDETFTAQVRVQFETAPALIGGVELVTHGQKVSWNIDDYLRALEHSVGELVDAPARPTQHGASEPPTAAKGGAHDPTTEQPQQPS